MTMLTFKEFLCILEDTDTDIANLTATKQQLLVRKAQQDKPIDAQIANIDRQLFQKEKQKQNEVKKAGPTPTTPQQPQSNTTTTPGSAGSQTPGMASTSGTPQK